MDGVNGAESVFFGYRMSISASSTHGVTEISCDMRIP
jgi:hypothetical protein